MGVACGPVTGFSRHGVPTVTSPEALSPCAGDSPSPALARGSRGLGFLEFQRFVCSDGLRACILVFEGFVLVRVSFQAGCHVVDLRFCNHFVHLETP